MKFRRRKRIGNRACNAVAHGFPHKMQVHFAEHGLQLHEPVQGYCRVRTHKKHPNPIAGILQSFCLYCPEFLAHYAYSNSFFRLLQPWHSTFFYVAASVYCNALSPYSLTKLMIPCRGSSAHLAPTLYWQTI